jgi:hypothetical protein
VQFSQESRVVIRFHDFLSFLFLLFTGHDKVSNFTSLPVSNHQSRDCICISISSLDSLSHLESQLLDEIFCIFPLLNPVCLDQTLLVCSIQDALNMDFWFLDLLSSHYSLQYNISLCIIRVVDDSRAVDEVDSLGHSDVLPHFGLSRHRGYFTDLLLSESIDD